MQIIIVSNRNNPNKLMTMRFLFILLAKKDGCINVGSWIHPLKYRVSKANIDRYLWLATCMGGPIVKEENNLGLE
jgi:hypothetical protein